MLDDVPPELLEQAIAAFAPMPAMRAFSARQRQVWGETWLRWISEAGDRWEARPTIPSQSHQYEQVPAVVASTAGRGMVSAVGDLANLDASGSVMRAP